MSSPHEMAVSADFEARLDQALAGLPCFEGATEKRLAPLLPEKFVLAGNYIKSFPQHGFSVSNSVNEEERYLLSPTCCYPVFYDLKDSQHAETLLVTHKNLCFRCEEYYKSGVRQIAYTMREYILMCERLEDVTIWIEGVKAGNLYLQINDQANFTAFCNRPRMGRVPSAVGTVPEMQPAISDIHLPAASYPFNKAI